MRAAPHPDPLPAGGQREKTASCMNTGIQRASIIIDRFNRGIGLVAAWSVLAMVLVQFAVIVMRALFGIGSLWMQESLFYFHALLVLFTAAWTLQANGHVRVDIF